MGIVSRVSGAKKYGQSMLITNGFAYIGKGKKRR
jgi:hypothetical protein